MCATTLLALGFSASRFRSFIKGEGTGMATTGNSLLHHGLSPYAWQCFIKAETALIVKALLFFFGIHKDQKETSDCCVFMSSKPAITESAEGQQDCG